MKNLIKHQRIITRDLANQSRVSQDPPESSEKTGWLLRAAAAYYCNGCAQDINNGRVELLKKDDSSEESIGDTKRQSDRQAYDDEAQIGYCPHIFTFKDSSWSSGQSACGAVVRGVLRRTRDRWFDLALMSYQASHPSELGLEHCEKVRFASSMEARHCSNDSGRNAAVMNNSISDRYVPPHRRNRDGTAAEEPSRLSPQRNADSYSLVHDGGSRRCAYPSTGSDATRTSATCKRVTPKPRKQEKTVKEAKVNNTSPFHFDLQKKTEDQIVVYGSLIVHKNSEVDIKTDLNSILDKTNPLKKIYDEKQNNEWCDGKIKQHLALPTVTKSGISQPTI
ncbi:hypothetical protein KIN20_017442 [Parelaphostrongylus tenuis]|uniref:Uncharacterized protein n=1 Tax=Parelaphostrongylus tenuis TaxID=148309 RepID=A0AAD5QTT7_PARTN|nr:hypothetical protein KIN20_017442 [Parelaphostrongylus tenuis]